MWPAANQMPADAGEQGSHQYRMAHVRRSLLLRRWRDQGLPGHAPLARRGEATHSISPADGPRPWLAPDLMDCALPALTSCQTWPPPLCRCPLPALGAARGAAQGLAPEGHHAAAPVGPGGRLLCLHIGRALCAQAKLVRQAHRWGAAPCGGCRRLQDANKAGPCCEVLSAARHA